MNQKKIVTIRIRTSDPAACMRHMQRFERGVKFPTQDPLTVQAVFDKSQQASDDFKLQLFSD